MGSRWGFVGGLASILARRTVSLWSELLWQHGHESQSASRGVACAPKVVVDVCRLRYRASPLSGLGPRVGSRCGLCSVSRSRV